ncbi:hypothetical protein EON64_15770 [archaeon]|nr:MAG: hypothetical protein EON64_15770 [archaeon]
MTDAILSVNFLRYRAGVSLRIPIELRAADQSPDIKRGGYVVPVKPFLSCVVQEGAAVPRSLPLDLSGALKGQVFRVANLSLPPCVRPARGEDGDRVVAVIKAAKG